MRRRLVALGTLLVAVLVGSLFIYWGRWMYFYGEAVPGFIYGIMMVGFGASFMVLGVLLGLRMFGFFVSKGSERTDSLKKKERVTPGQKIVSLYLLSLGLIFFSLSAVIYPWSGDSSSNGHYFTLIIGALFVLVAVLVFLDARFRPLPQETPPSKEAKPPSMSSGSDIVLKKRARLTLGQKVVSIFLLCIGLFFLLLGILFYLSGVTTPPFAFGFGFLVVGLALTIVAILVVLDARSRALPEKVPLSKDAHRLPTAR